MSRKCSPWIGLVMLVAATFACTVGQIPMAEPAQAPWLPWPPSRVDSDVVALQRDLLRSACHNAKGPERIAPGLLFP